jgi:DNA-binding NarL/FixJ family response regulator
MTIRVVLADDQHLVRTGFEMILERTPDIEVVGHASNGGEAVSVCRDLHPDVVLMDVRMPGTDGIEATRQLRADSQENGGPLPLPLPLPRVLILTTFDLDEYVLAGLRAGASGFLLKDTLAPDLIAAIRAVVAGDAVIAPSATRRLLERFIPAGEPVSPAVARPDLAVLTAREREVLELVARGLANAGIAQRLYISEGTVKTHVGRILHKLGLRDRVQAVILAYESGLIHPGESPQGLADRP